MSRKKIIVILVLVIAAAGGWYAYSEYSRTNKDLSRVKPDYRLEAIALIREYEGSDTMATRKYNGKVVEVNGVVKGVEKDEKGYYTVVLGDTTRMSSVRCALDTTHQDGAAALAHGQMATLRGACTGFNKDDMGLGSDVILNRCVIISTKD